MPPNVINILKKKSGYYRRKFKALQWQRLSDELTHFEERISTVTLQREQQLSDQRHLETDIEKSRLAQTEANDQQNEIQKRYYALGAEIARIEQRIKDTQEQTQRWRSELEDAENLWQELTESSAEHQDQIQEITAEVAELAPQAETIQAVAEAAQKALSEAEVEMNAWQSEWEAYQKAHAQARQQAEVARTNISHYEQQIESLIQREQRLRESNDPSQLTTLAAALAPIAEQTNALNTQLETIQSTLNASSEKMVIQRQQNTEDNSRLNNERRDLQADEARYASLRALQEAALSGDEQANAWLEAHKLAEASRLGKTLQVNPGWELAVESVIGGYFDAVCVEDAVVFADQLDLEQGGITLVDRHAAIAGVKPKAPSLADQVSSDWPITSWLSMVYTADSTQQALSMRHHLSPQESVITREGLWIGANWVRQVKTADNKAGVLAREQELKALTERITEKQKAVDELQSIVDSGQAKLAELENERDEQHKAYQLLSRELTQAKTDLSAKRSRYDELQQQQARLKDETERCREQIDRSNQALAQAKAQLEQSSQELQQQLDKKDGMLGDRDRYRQALQSAREKAQREQQKADELDIRLASNESQLSLLKQTVAHAERQMQQLSDRREHLTTQLADTDSPLNHLSTELQAQLNKRIAIEEELHTAEEALEAYNQQVRQLEAKRSQVQNQLDELKDQLQSINMERQAIIVRQSTIQEQLTEFDLALESVLEAMPEEAAIQQWEIRAEQLAQKISRLGPINLAAIEEFDQISERKTYLDKQQADLQEALEVLQNAIRKIDRETRHKFKETYDQVNASFKVLFPKIFGGGAASLALEEDDLLASGVIIRAQPPGKRNSTIHMLSGGEKALTAISLVFALFQLNPAPFCVLDEVDAPLDDVNVGRFCHLVKEMAKTTQFIVISHNKVTIEMADHLMGVTMQEPGASRIVSVDMEEAIAMAEA